MSPTGLAQSYCFALISLLVVLIERVVSPPTICEAFNLHYTMPGSIPPKRFQDHAVAAKNAPEPFLELVAVPASCPESSGVVYFGVNMSFSIYR